MVARWQRWYLRVAILLSISRRPHVASLSRWPSRWLSRGTCRRSATLFWRRFNTRSGWAIYGGLISAVVLVIFSPVVSGKPTALISDKNFAWFPLENPGIISIPAGFFFGWLGTVLSKERDDAKYDELEVRSLTGAGAH